MLALSCTSIARSDEWERLTKQCIAETKQGHHQQALVFARQAYKLAKRTKLGTLPLSCYFLGHAYQQQGNYLKAEIFYKQALSMLNVKVTKDAYFRTVFLNSLVYLYKKKGRYNEIEQLDREELRIQEQEFGKSSLELVRALNNLGFFYLNQHHYITAEPFFKRALTIVKSHYGPQHYKVAKALDNLGLLYATLGSDYNAKLMYQRSLAIYNSTGKKELAVKAAANLYLIQRKSQVFDGLFKYALVSDKKA